MFKHKTLVAVTVTVMPAQLMMYMYPPTNLPILLT